MHGDQCNLRKNWAQGTPTICDIEDCKDDVRDSHRKKPQPHTCRRREQAVITAIVTHAPSTRNGDDAAVLDHAAPNSRTVITTDTLVEGRHFRRDWSHPAEIGRKAITQNFADVEAMGARPIAALLALSAPGDTPLEFVADLARGINERVTDYDAELVGGDVTDMIGSLLRSPVSANLVVPSRRSGSTRPGPAKSSSPPGTLGIPPPAMRC